MDRPLLGIALLSALIISLIILGTLRLVETRTSYQDAHDRLAECQAMVAAIRELRESESVAVGSNEVELNSNEPLHTVVKQAGVLPSQIQSTEWLDAANIEGSNDYQRLDVHLAITGVSMEQVCQLVYLLESPPSDWVCTSASLVPTVAGPTEEGKPELWNIDLGLTRLVFTAKSR